MTEETLTTVLLLSHERGHTGQSRVLRARAQLGTTPCLERKSGSRRNRAQCPSYVLSVNIAQEDEREREHRGTVQKLAMPTPRRCCEYVLCCGSGAGVSWCAPLDLSGALALFNVLMSVKRAERERPPPPKWQMAHNTCFSLKKKEKEVPPTTGNEAP